MRFPAAAALALCLAAVASAEDAGVVKRIEIDGLRIHTADEVREKMETHTGRPYSREMLERDIQRLFATGWFEDVRRSPRSVETGPDAVVIILEVSENDVLREIRYAGNRHFDDDDLVPGALMKTGEYFAPWKIKLEADRVRDKYLDDGYAWAKVTPSETSTGRGTIVTFTVREGPKTHAGNITFYGNVNVSKFALWSEMQTSRATIWNFIVPPAFKTSQLDEDIKSLLRYYRSEGYLDARVYVRDLDWNPEKSRVDVNIQVEEGTLYLVDAVEIEGATVFSANDLYTALRVKPGKPYALKDVDIDELYLLDRLREAAYIDASADPVPRYLPEKGHIKLTWRIREGKKVFVGRIDIVGNHRTREKVIRRQLLLLPGEEFNKVALEASVDRLKYLRFFEPTSPQLYSRAWGPVRDPEIVVEVLPGLERDERDVLIHVQEGRTGNLQIGGSYSDEGGISGKLAVTQNNFDLLDLPKSLLELITGEAFAGAQQVARIDLEPGFRRSNYEVAFTEPWFLDYPISMTLAGSFFDHDVDFYRERRLGGSLDFGHRWDEFAAIVPGKLSEDLSSTFLGGFLQGLSYAAIHLPAYFIFDDHVVHGYDITNFWKRNYTVGVGYRFERINILDVSDTAPDDVFDVAGVSYLSSITVRVSLDRRFSRTFPSEGFQTSVSYEHAGYPLGGYYDFWKIQFRHQAFSTLWTVRDGALAGGKIIFETDLRGGLAQEHYYSTDVPIFERFYAPSGNPPILRGLEPRTAGPKDGSDPIGGTVMTLASAEITFPILRPRLFGRDTDVLRGAIFTDWGTVVAHPRDYGYFRWTAGVGVRLQIPLGPQIIPVTIDYGIPIFKQKDDRRQAIHIGFDFGF